MLSLLASLFQFNFLSLIPHLPTFILAPRAKCKISLGSPPLGLFFCFTCEILKNVLSTDEQLAVGIIGQVLNVDAHTDRPSDFFFFYIKMQGGMQGILMVHNMCMQLVPDSAFT